MHRRTIKSFAALATVALAVSGAGSMASAASAAVSHKPPVSAVTTTTKLPTRGVVRVVKGSAPGKGQEMNNVCQQYAGLIDEALDGVQRDTIANDTDGAHQWHDLANEIAQGGVAQGCQFTFSAS